MTDPNVPPALHAPGLPPALVVAISRYGRTMFDFGSRVAGQTDTDWDDARDEIALLVTALSEWCTEREAAVRRHALEEAIQAVWAAAEEYEADRDATDPSWRIRAATAQVIARRLRAISTEQATGSG